MTIPPDAAPRGLSETERGGRPGTPCAHRSFVETCTRCRDERIAALEAEAKTLRVQVAAYEDGVAEWRAERDTLRETTQRLRADHESVCEMAAGFLRERDAEKAAHAETKRGLEEMAERWAIADANYRGVDEQHRRLCQDYATEKAAHETTRRERDEARTDREENARLLTELFDGVAHTLGWEPTRPIDDLSTEAICKAIGDTCRAAFRRGIKLAARCANTEFTQDGWRGDPVLAARIRNLTDDAGEGE